MCCAHFFFRRDVAFKLLSRGVQAVMAAPAAAPEHVRFHSGASKHGEKSGETHFGGKWAFRDRAPLESESLGTAVLMQCTVEPPRTCLFAACFSCCKRSNKDYHVKASICNRYRRFFTFWTFTIFALAFVVCLPAIIPLVLLYRYCTFLPIPACFPQFLHTTLFGRSGRRTIQSSNLCSEKKISQETTRKRVQLEIEGMRWKFPYHFEKPVITFFGLGNIPNPNAFDPVRPTLLYVHGMEPGTTRRGFRETFATPSGIPSVYETLPTGDFWIRRGFNISIFYWNQYSDDPDRRAVERKIYEAGKLPYTIMMPSGEVCNVCPTESTSSVADQLLEQVVKIFSAPNCGDVHLVGHSIGAQLCLEMMRRLALRESCKVPSVRKLVLLDPYFTSRPCDYLDMETAAARAKDSLAIIREELPAVVVETKITSVVGEGRCGSDCTRTLRRLTNYTKLPISRVSWMDVVQRHCLAHHLHMLSILDERTLSTASHTTGEQPCQEYPGAAS